MALPSIVVTAINNAVAKIKGQIQSDIEIHNGSTGSSSNFGHVKAGGAPQDININGTNSAGTDNGYYARADHQHKIATASTTGKGIVQLDNTPTTNSINAITSGAVKTALDSLISNPSSGGKLISITDFSVTDMSNWWDLNNSTFNNLTVVNDSFSGHLNANRVELLITGDTEIWLGDPEEYSEGYYDEYNNEYIEEYSYIPPHISIYVSVSDPSNSYADIFYEMDSSYLGDSLDISKPITLINGVLTFTNSDGNSIEWTLNDVNYNHIEMADGNFTLTRWTGVKNRDTGDFFEYYLTQIGNDTLNDGIYLVPNGNEYKEYLCIDDDVIPLFSTTPRKLPLLNNDTSTVNKIVVTDSGSNIKTINALPYNKLSGTPTIPSKTSQLTNDSGFITALQGATIPDIQKIIAGITGYLWKPALKGECGASRLYTYSESNGEGVGRGFLLNNGFPNTNLWKLSFEFKHDNVRYTGINFLSEYTGAYHHNGNALTSWEGSWPGGSAYANSSSGTVNWFDVTVTKVDSTHVRLQSTTLNRDTTVEVTWLPNVNRLTCGARHNESNSYGPCRIRNVEAIIL